MSGLPLSASTRALLEAAKSDAPAASARANIWAGVSTAAGLGAAAATPSVAPSVAGGTGVSASKLLAMGALLGSAVTVGVTLAVLRVMSPHPATYPGGSVTAGTAATPGVAGVEATSAGGLGVSPKGPGASLVGLDHAQGAGSNAAINVNGNVNGDGNRGIGGAGSGSAVEADRAKDVGGSARALHPSSSVTHVGGAARPAAKASPIQPPFQREVDDPLMHEAALVAEARGSLVRGDAIGALRTIRAAESLSSRRLEPEELSIEGHALRVLGRDAEAAGVDSDLRSRFPEHALSR